MIDSRATSLVFLRSGDVVFCLLLPCGKMGVHDHLTCLLRNLFASQEATIGTGLGTAERK